jgi:hypothetical protein
MKTSAKRIKQKQKQKQMLFFIYKGKSSSEVRSVSIVDRIMDFIDDMAIWSFNVCTHQWRLGDNHQRNVENGIYEI